MIDARADKIAPAGHPAVPAVTVGEVDPRVHGAGAMVEGGGLARYVLGVAHDFNNLLTVILSFTTVLREDLAAGVPVNPADLDEIQAAAVRASHLTGQLLTVARKDRGVPVPLDLNRLVVETQGLLSGVLPADVTVALRLSRGLWAVFCDAGHLGQVLLNLVLHAGEAMPTGGAVTIETRNSIVDGEWPDDGAPHPIGSWVRLRISDHGEGMAPEAMVHLFEPRLTAEPIGTGSGLGLATANSLVLAAGGHIHVESVPGQGTAFEVCLPRTLRQPAAEGPAAQPDRA